MPDRIVSAQTGDLNPSMERIRALDASMILQFGCSDIGSSGNSPQPFAGAVRALTAMMFRIGPLGHVSTRPLPGTALSGQLKAMVVAGRWEGGPEFPLTSEAEVAPASQP